MPVATLSHGDKVFRFRTNPNAIRWSYRLKTSVTNTYGGRVIQILSASVDDLVVTADAGGGGWDYLYSSALFFRDMLIDQRENGTPGVFEYAPRGWKLGVYAMNFPFRDSVTEVRREFTMQFKVQEDISGIVTTDSIAQEIARLQEGIGWTHNDYNTPTPAADDASMRSGGQANEQPQPLDQNGAQPPAAVPRAPNLINPLGF